MKPSSAFARCVLEVDGLQSKCRECFAVVKAKYRAKLSSRACVDAPSSQKCGACQTEKPSDQFACDKSAPNGLQNACKACQSQRRKPSSDYNRLRRYGLAPEAVDAMIAQQHGKCALCPKYLSNLKRICVDHDHTTSAVRGLLCDSCNLRLRGFETSGYLAAADAYLEREWTPWSGDHSRKRKAVAMGLLAAQQGRCGICETSVADFRRGVAAVDHCHETDLIRGVLCWTCNLYLPAAENLVWRMQAERYVLSGGVRG